MLEAKKSGYHPGMEPDKTWDAQMLLDGLDEIWKKDIFYVSNTFTRAQTILERMREEDPARYAFFTDSETWDPKYNRVCRDMMLLTEDVKEEGSFLRTRISEQVVVIEQSTESLCSDGEALFDFEKVRLSTQIREATEALEALREKVMMYFFEHAFEVIVGKMMIEGDLDDAENEFGVPVRFSEWMMAVLDTEAGPQEATVPASAVISAGYNTRMSRMAAGSRVLEANSRDVRVLVITENDFAVELHGVDNAPVVGAKVTVTDLNGTKVATGYTQDPDVGSAVFNANEFFAITTRRWSCPWRWTPLSRAIAAFTSPGCCSSAAACTARR